MEIREITSREIWDGFVRTIPDYTFLQSFSWGEFNARMGSKIWRLGLFEEGGLIGVCLLIKIQARRGNFLFAPHGPIIKELTNEKFDLLIKKFKEIGMSENCSFLRISPWLLKTEENLKLFERQGFRDAPTYMHTEDTWILNIEKSEEELLLGMRKTTRNLVRRAERDGVKILKTQELSDLKFLLELQTETAKRHGFVPFSRKYLETEINVFKENGECLLFLGSFEGKVQSAAIIIFYGERAFYFQSASSSTKEPVSYLLQWEVIREAKKRFCREYNFWGIAPKNEPNHPWVGLTLFKQGFGGFEKNYMHAKDLILSKKYWLTYVVEKIPRSWRPIFFKVFS